MMALMKMSEVAAYNNAPHEARNYRVPLEPVDGFNPGDYVPVVVYNAFVGSSGKSMRSLAQKTHAHLFNDHAVLDEFDPSIDFSRTPDGHPLFELVGYLIDLNGKEHLFFTIKFQKDEVKPKKLYPSDEFPVGSSPTVRIYRGGTRKRPGPRVAEVTGLITENGLDLPSETFLFCVNPATGEFSHIKDLNVCLVASDGTERYAFSVELKPGQPPPLSSLLSEPDSVH